MDWSEKVKGGESRAAPTVQVRNDEGSSTVKWSKNGKIHPRPASPTKLPVMVSIFHICTVHYGSHCPHAASEYF